MVAEASHQASSSLRAAQIVKASRSHSLSSAPTDDHSGMPVRKVQVIVACGRVLLRIEQTPEGLLFTLGMPLINAAERGRSDVTTRLCA
mmetsp:Transcript_2945/g.9038  ORF Transcript_2945/g.9038 Transcript_2945/m.9038 type:complete len:89 (+) Transcript_2945:1786-2052(+)